MSEFLPRDIDDNHLTYGGVTITWPHVATLVHPSYDAPPNSEHWTDLAVSSYFNCFALTGIHSELWLSTVRSRDAFATGMCLKFPHKSAATALEALKAAYRGIADSNVPTTIEPATESSSYQLEAYDRRGFTHNNAVVWMTGTTEMPPMPGHSDRVRAYGVFTTLAFATAALLSEAIRKRRPALTLNLQSLKGSYPHASVFYPPPSREPRRLLIRGALAEKLFPTQTPGDDLINGSS